MNWLSDKGSPPKYSAVNDYVAPSAALMMASRRDNDAIIKKVSEPFVQMLESTGTVDLTECTADEPNYLRFPQAVFFLTTPTSRVIEVNVMKAGQTIVRGGANSHVRFFRSEDATVIWLWQYMAKAVTHRLPIPQIKIQQNCREMRDIYNAMDAARGEWTRKESSFGLVSFTPPACLR